jgi:alpha-galactosidase
MQAANAMVDLGFKDAGYEYVVLDDCWSEMKGRDPVTSRLVPNTTKFPDGMSGTADKVHALGLKYGMYSSAGTMTCGRYPGSLGYEAIDAATFAEWGVDYLKVSADLSWVGSLGTGCYQRRTSPSRYICPPREMSACTQSQGLS